MIYECFCVCTCNWFNSLLSSAQAESLGTQILDEDGLLDLIRTKPGKKSKYEIAAEAQVSPPVSNQLSS